ncbi:disease resistance RPP13-like protein 4 [Rhodamnia argentea]|uniref:Disease resistance RPP13-like protein 4 n=1 Tax=Rhodamnia argentea TaxID=178133 RepID=A0A8B8P4T9_9MYRT|nr:disease resistance RPP13-like protein 4 [Rhodamnia argentea]
MSIASTMPPLPPDGPPPLPSHGDVQNVETIIKTIPALLDFVNKVKGSLPEPEIQSAGGAVAAEEKQIEAEDDGGETVRCWSGGFAGGKKGVGSKKADAVPNGGRRNTSGAKGGGGDSKGGGGGSGSASSRGSNGTLRNEAEKLRRDLNYIERALSKFRKLEVDFGLQFKNIEEQRRALDQILSSMAQVQKSTSATSSQQVHNKFRSISAMVTNLKLQIPSLHKLSTSNTNAHQLDTGFVFNAYYLVDEMLKQDMKEKVMGAPAFDEFFNDLLCVFEDLDRRSKLCLLCFSVFPENAVLRKRLLVNWWIGEGLADSDGASVDGIFKELIAKGFVEPVLKKRKVTGFKMDPLVRFAVIAIAEKVGFFGFNAMGVPTEDFSWSYRACLVRTEGESSRERLTKKENDLEKLRTIFNVNDPYPDFKLDWFSKLKNLNVLYLGSWQDFAKHHIEVEGTEFLKGLKLMKHLQFLSLQGISRITDLPDSICKLTSLKILDLNACHNLELLPKNIGALKKLTHLDISQCYLLDHIPKELSSLTQLQVLKGFVIGDSISTDSCTLEELKGLMKLRKLSIYTGRENFPTNDELKVLEGFQYLQKLTIAWGGKPSKDEQNENSTQPNYSAKSSTADSVKMGDKTNSTKTQQDNISGPPQPAQTAPARRKLSRALAFKGRLPTETSSPNAGDMSGLEKLELQCFPGTAAPAWLIEGKLKPVKCLYISGGNLQELGTIQRERITWEVRILCLKFLSELKMDWGDLQKSFPNLIYLEKVKCPKLSFFPCDERGVWLNGEMEAKRMEESGLSLSWSFLKHKDTICPTPVSSSNTKP